MPPIGDNNAKSNRVRFDSSCCDYIEDFNRASQVRSFENEEFRRRSSSVSAFAKTDPAKETNVIDRRDLYIVVNSDRTGGTLRGMVSPHRQVFFDIKYTTFNGASLKVAKLDNVIQKGDIVVVGQKYQFYNYGGVIEWRAMEMRYPNSSDPESIQWGNFTESNVLTWVTHGRIMHCTMHHATRQDLVISTGFGDNNIFAVKESCVGNLSTFEQNITVLVRAELKKGAKHQAANFKWFGVSVQVVGEVKKGEGLLKQMNFGRKPFVIIASHFGYVMVPKEAQKACAKILEDGTRVTFDACSNLPCHRYGLKSRPQWRAINFSGLKKRGSEESGVVQILPPLPFSNMSTVTATTCYSCQGELVCICY